LLSALILSGLAGCVKSRCYGNSDCPTPQMCNSAGACAYVCSDSTPCEPGFVCVDHTCQRVAPPDSTPVTCPADMVVVADSYCVDRYEAARMDATATSAGSDESQAKSVAGVLPWQVINNGAAAQACAAAGKRLCSATEWQLACEGPQGTTYSYGDTYNPTTCNGIDTYSGGRFHLAPTGSFPDCTNDWGVFDINGNLWEHTAGGDTTTIRGGAYNCSDSATLHRCDYIPLTWSPSARGFRCCADGTTA